MSNLKTPLLEHQKRISEKLKKQPGLVVAHGLGSGKTLASIGAASEHKGDSRALVPASLMGNYINEIKKHTKKPPDISVQSLQRAVLKKEQEPTDLLIVDEAHRARGTKTKLNKLLKEYPSKKRLLLTATPIYNRPSDIAALINIAANKEVLPEGQDFNKRYIEPGSSSILASLFGRDTKDKIKNKQELKKIINKWVDYHAVKGKDFPTKREEVISVEMSPLQSKIHNLAWNKLPLHSRLKLKAGLNPTKKELSKINNFQAQTRQVGGTVSKFLKDTDSELSPKLDVAIKRFQERLDKDPKHKAVIFSNYLDTLKDYSEELEKEKIPYNTFVGGLSMKERENRIDQYNKGLIKALLVSSAGGEGLNLKGTRQVQVLEPHWNEEKLEQVIGRAIRRGSHTHLPKSKRNVDVERYLTHPKRSVVDKMIGRRPEGVEDILYNLSKDKKELNEQVLGLLESSKRKMS